jgi:hypothetical protein
MSKVGQVGHTGSEVGQTHFLGLSHGRAVI